MTARQIGHNIAAGIQWSARILGPVASGLCVYCLVQPDARIFQWLAGSDLTGTPLYLVLSVAVGVSAGAWWREAAGGLTAFSGGVLILALAHSEPGSGIPLAAFVLTLPLLAIGAAHMLGTFLSKVLGNAGTASTRVVDGKKWAVAGGV